MVKKITAAVILICMLSIVLSGCSFLYKNEQRDGEQAIAVVRYGGRVAYVTKSELSAVYNQSGYLYIYYYGWTAEETFEQLVDSLSYNALLGLKAKDYLTNEVDGITLSHSTVNMENPTTAEQIAEMEEMLTKKYLKAAVEDTNTTFRDAYDDFIDEINEENELANGTDEDEEEEEEEEEEETVEPRPQPAEEEEEEDEATIVVPEDFFTIINAEISAMPTATTEEKDAKKVAVEALRRLNKSLTDTYRDYDYYYCNQLLTQVIERYKEEYKATLADPTEAEILARYNEMLQSNINSFATEGNYAKELEESYKDIIYHPGYTVSEEKGYFFVMNILMKFSDEQSEMLSQFTDSEVATEDAITAYREYLSTLITVNVSNTEYDAEIGETEDNKMYTSTDVAINEILDLMEDELNAATTVAERIEVFKNWTYLVNDDPGAFTAIDDGKPGYLVTPEGEESSYVTEFTDLARALSEVGEGAYGLNAGELSYCVTDYGIHVMLVTYYPFDYAEKAGNDPVLVTVDDGLNLLTLDYIIDIEEGTTLREYISDTLKEEKATNMQTVMNTQLYRENKDEIEAFPKVYKDLLKEAEKLEQD